ncbi:MinD/ParA family protein [Microbacterium sp.]|uniref:nucleotide-binding protein n=1 Tax=Microbacterium sp. TaxID=51671 RepID=UPI0028112C21|nr:MinD/ParA family protein [Microbacterium sp.]
MTPKNTPDPEGDDSLGVLDDTPSSDTTGIGLLGGTAQVSVSLPKDDDDDLADEEVVDGEIVSDLIIDTSAVADEVTVARMSRDTPDIVIELPAGELPEPQMVDAEPEVDEPLDAHADAGEEIVIDAEPVEAEPDSTDAPAGAVTAEDTPQLENIESAVAAAKAQLREAMSPSTAKKPAPKATAKNTAKRTAAKSTDGTQKAAPEAADAKPETPTSAAARRNTTQEADVATASSKPAASDAAQATASESAGESAAIAPSGSAKRGAPADAAKATAGSGRSAAAPAKAEPAKPEPPKAEPAKAEPAEVVGRKAESVRPEPTKVETTRTAATTPERAGSDTALTKESPVAARAATTVPAPADVAPQPAARAEENRPVNDTAHHDDQSGPASGVARPGIDVELTAKRLDDLGDASRESADLLTADRLLDPSRVSKPEPEGTWSHLLYTLSGGRINIGDSRKARERKQLTARIAAPLAGSARFVPVLSRKGGVGKTTVTALLGMALADARDDRVIAVDANPDRGTLAERVVGVPAKSVRDLVRAQHGIRGFHDISALVARDETRLDVLASDADPRVAEAFDDSGYRDVAAVAAQYYSLVLTDSGTGIVHSVMSATLDLADQLVIVSGLSVDEARLASETLTWLETNGHAALARDAIVVLNQSTSGAPMVRLSELEAHFSTRARHVLRVPYDPQIAGGGAIDFASLQPETRQAARELAAALVEGLRARAA